MAKQDKRIEVVRPDSGQLRSMLPHVGKLDFEQVAELALTHFDTVVEDILELEGKYEGKEFVAFNPRRRDNELGSFKVNSETGVFCDFACDDECRGGDLIGLAAYVWDCDRRQAALRLRNGLSERQIEMPSGGVAGPVVRETVGRHIVSPDLMPPIPEGSPELDVHRFVPRGRTFEARYDYVNADGALCFVHLRLRDAGGRKTFVTLHVERCEDGSLVWAGGMPNGLRPLFGLRELIEGRAESSVCVVEGEKAALAFRQLGGNVVTSAGGANAAAKSDWSPLAGRRVVIWPDNDEAGLKYRDQVVGLIRAVEPATRIATIDPAKLMRSICEVQGWDYAEKAESMRGWDAADVMELGLEDAVLSELLSSAVPSETEQGESTTVTDLNRPGFGGGSNS